MLEAEDQEVMRSSEGVAFKRVDYFTPDVPPTDVEELPVWLANQLQQLQSALFNINSLHLERMYDMPARFKPREGDIILAAAGLDPSIIAAGLYYFTGDTWKLIA